MPTRNHRVFVARLAGTPVFDPNGDQVGKVRDVVVVLRHGTQPPRVLGLVVEVPPRRRIFLPMTRITGMNPDQVLSNGVVNMRRFEPRPNELLVFAELVDKRVTLLESGEQVTIVDAGMEQFRDGDWSLVELFVRKGGGKFRRRGETAIVNWHDVAGLSLEDPDQAVEALLASMEGMRPADAANVLRDLPERRRIDVARGLDDERLADVVEELPDADRLVILGHLDAERAAAILAEMDPDDAADLLGDLPPEQAAGLLSLVEPEEAEDLRRLLAYDEDSAGGLMTTEPVILPPDATVAEALAQVRSPDLSPALAAQVYVTRAPQETPTGRYLGVAHFQRMLREPPSSLVTSVLDRDLEPVLPSTPLARVSRYFATYNLVAMPVVDESGALLGVVTVDDVLDHLLPEDWRSMDDADREVAAADTVAAVVAAASQPPAEADAGPALDEGQS